MSITLFQPTVWSAQLLAKLAKSLVYGSAPVVNRDYEGEITDFGSSVAITAIADPVITTYNKDTDMTAVQALTDTQQTLLINQAKMFNFQVDNIDERQVRDSGNLMNQAAIRAAFGLADVADQYIAGLMALNSTQPLGLVDAHTTSTNVYDQLIVPASVALDQVNIPSEGRWLVVDPATYGKMQLDLRFVAAYASGNSALHTGQVGTASGFTIFKSNNAPTSNRVVAGVGTTNTTGALVGPAGSFNQGDVGLSLSGTGVGASAVVASVSADGGTITASVVSTATGSISLTISGGGKVCIAGSQMAFSYAEQISKVTAYQPEKRFGDALKGLHLYGGKTVRPESLVVASVRTV